MFVFLFLIAVIAPIIDRAVGRWSCSLLLFVLLVLFLSADIAPVLVRVFVRRPCSLFVFVFVVLLCHV